MRSLGEFPENMATAGKPRAGFTCAGSWKCHRRASCTMQNLAIVHRAHFYGNARIPKAAPARQHRGSPGPWGREFRRAGEEPTQQDQGAHRAPDISLSPRRPPGIHPRHRHSPFLSCRTAGFLRREAQAPERGHGTKSQRERGGKSHVPPQPLRRKSGGARAPAVSRMPGAAGRGRLPGVHAALTACPNCGTAGHAGRPRRRPHE